MMWELQAPIQRVNIFQFTGAARPGGNHYHLKGIETLLVISGSMTLVVIEDIQTEERWIGRDLGPGSLVVLEPGFAHANAFELGTIVVVTSTEKFDPADLIPYQLIDTEGKIIPQGIEEKLSE